ncbi:hypothetical protein STHU_10040 [Allostella humosa]|nr:hypothetical protein STHU_10040 [Stella humosa]
MWAELPEIEGFIAVRDKLVYEEIKLGQIGQATPIDRHRPGRGWSGAISFLGSGVGYQEHRFDSRRLSSRLRQVVSMISILRGVALNDHAVQNAADETRVFHIFRKTVTAHSDSPPHRDRSRAGVTTITLTTLTMRKRAVGATSSVVQLDGALHSNDNQRRRAACVRRP